MVRKTASQLRNSGFQLSESDLAEQIGRALYDELGGSRRAIKTLMRWSGVSDTAARSWLQERVTPSGLHLLALAARSNAVMVVLLRATGHPDLEIGLRLEEIEEGLVQALACIRAIGEA